MFDKSSLDEQNANKQSLKVDNRRGDNTSERLENNDGEVQLEDKNLIFKPIWKDNAGEYLQRVSRCGLLITEKCKRQHKKELKKSTFTIKSIVDIFSAKSNKIMTNP